MTYIAKKCGIQFQPPSIILIYEDQLKNNVRKRIMPIRNFSKFSGTEYLFCYFSTGPLPK